MKTLYALFPRLEFRFGLHPAAEIIDGSLVFRAEALLQSLGLLFLVEKNTASAIAINTRSTIATMSNVRVSIAFILKLFRINRWPNQIAIVVFAVLSDDG